MWIKKPPVKLGKSLSKSINFLYNTDNIYIMDNHLAAGWSWLQEINYNNKHYYLHIDRHYDLLGFKETIQSQIIEKGIKLHNLSFKEYLNLKQPGSNGDLFQMFRWDNYILNLSYAYPHLFYETYFATHDDDIRDDDFINHDVSFSELVINIDNWIKVKNEKDWIVNLDIDYFFDYDKQIIEDKDIYRLAIKIKQILNKVKVFTLCLSPECCGGWENSINKAEIICKALDLNFIDELKRRTTYNTV